MRALIWTIGTAVSGVLATAVPVAVPAVVAAPAPSIAGAWKGPFLSSNFIFEFKHNGKSWTGRYQSEKFRKWVDLQNVTFADGTVRFDFVSQPPSTFRLKIDSAGKELSGSASFGGNAPLPLMLTRAS